MPDDFLRILMGHNAWATRVLLDQSTSVTPEQFHRRFEIGLGSIHDTLRHIIGAMLRWSDRIAVRTLRESIEKGGLLSVAELVTLLERADAELRAAVDQLDASDGWNDKIEFAVEGERTYRFSKATAMMHVLTHGVHHRAQIVNMRRQLGLPPLGIDLDAVEWECVQTGQM